MSDDLKKVGAKLVVEGLEESLQAFASLQDALNKLNGQSGFQLSAQLAKEFGVSASQASQVVSDLAKNAGTSFDVYARSLLETSTREKLFAEDSAKTFSELSEKQQQSLLEMSQRFVAFQEELQKVDQTWAETVNRSNLATTPQEQQAVVNAARDAQATRDYWINAFTEEENAFSTLVDKEKVMSNEFVVQEAQNAQKYADFWERANLDVVKSREAVNQSALAIDPKAGTLFSDPAREAEMRKAQEDNARIAAEAIAEAQKIVAESTTENISLSEMYTKQLMAQGLSAKAAAVAMKELGIAQNDLGEAEISDAEAAKIVEATHRRVTQAYADQEKQIKLLTTETEGSSGAHERLTASAVQSSRAFFALTLASFGLMSISQELKKAFGDDLPPAFERASSAIQQIASFGSAGAFIGGVPGAIFGGIAGGILAIGTAALTVDPQIQQLNQSLNNMSKQDETIATLAKVAGVSYDVAAAWDEAAKKSPEFAKELENITKKAEPVNGLLVSIKTGLHELGIEFKGLTESLGTAGEAMNKILLFTEASAVALIKFSDALLKGIPLSDALNLAQHEMYTVLTSVSKASAEAGVSIGDQNRLTAEAAAINAEAAKEAEKLASAEITLANALASADFRMAQLNQRTQDQRDAAKQSYDNAVADAARARGDAITNADQSWQDKDADLWQSWQDKIAEINSRLSDRLADIQTQLANKIEDAQQALADKIASLQQDLANKLAELAHKRQQSIEDANRKEEQAADDLARKLYEIERTRIEATEALAFNTHEQLRSAQTEHDKADVLRKAQFEKAQIDQKANDSRNDAQNDYATKIKQYELEKKLARDEYEYEVRLAKELEREKEIEARRATEEQIRQAQREAAQQTAIAKREQAEALAQAEHRYNEELATAKRTYEEAVAAAIRAENERNADAARALRQRNEAISKSAELERQQNEKTKEDAIKAYEEVISKIKDLRTQIAGILALVLELAKMPAFLAILAGNATAGLFKDWINNLKDFSKGPKMPSVGGYDGLDMTVPEGHPSDTYMIGARTGEHVVITPPGTSNSTSSKVANFYIYDATDPQKVGKVVEQKFHEAGWR